jgi:hypothetical protein
MSTLTTILVIKTLMKSARFATFNANHRSLEDKGPQIHITMLQNSIQIDAVNMALSYHDVVTLYPAQRERKPPVRSSFLSIAL